MAAGSPTPTDLPILVGLSGGSCAGKTTLAELIRRRLLPTVAAVITSDRYYLPLDHLPPEQRPQENFDSPRMLDRKLLEEHLVRLKAGKPTDLPIYDFRLHTRSKETKRMNPPPVIIVEGIFLLATSSLQRLLDFVIFIETREAVRLTRRLNRDREERGRTTEEILERYFAQVRPTHQKLVAPSRKQADLVVQGDETPANPVTLAVARIKQLLNVTHNAMHYE